MIRLLLAAGLLMTAVSPIAASETEEEPNYYIDENTGFKWIEVETDDGKKTWEVMDQELPEKRMVLAYEKMFRDVNLAPGHLASMRTADELKILKEDGIKIMNAPNSERLMRELFYSCLDRAKLSVPKVQVEFKLARYLKEDGRPPIFKAFPSGLILIGPKALKKIDDPGVLLYFMAHEYGHIVMQHPEDPVQALEGQITQTEASGGFLSTIGSTMFSGIRSVGNAVSAAAGDGTGFDKRLQNSAKRFQEDQADMYGADILLGCGYRTNHISKAFKTFGGWAAEGVSFLTARANMEDANDRIEISQKDGDEVKKDPDVATRVEGGSGFLSFFSPGGQKKDPDDDTAGRAGFGGAMFDSVEAMKEETEYEHRAVDARNAFIKNYFKAHYRERPKGSKSARTSDKKIYDAFRREAAGIVKKYGGG